MKTEKQSSKKYHFQRENLSSLINNIIRFYTKVFITLFGDEMRTRHQKSKINVRSTCELSDHMKRDLGLD